MENPLLALAIKSMPENVLFITFIISVVLYLACGFAIVCLIHSLGNKLILLGLLTAGAALIFAVTMSDGANLAWVLMFSAFFLVFYGATKYSQ
ncbi:MAG: hypothetical protein ACYS6W_17505 [Planctomycetota bacterium]|jgi:hypothetical protein